VSCDDGDACTINDEQTVLDSDGTICIPCAGTLVTLVADAGSDALITCNLTSVILNAGGTIGANEIVNWSGPGIIDPTNPNQIVSTAGTFILSLSNPNGCFSEPDTVIVTENTIPPNAIIQFTGSLDCFISSVLLTAETEPNAIYEWLMPDGSISTDLEIEGTIGGTYYLSVIDTINGCSNLDSALIDDITAYPFVEAGNDQTLDCNNTSLTLDGTGTQIGATIIYEWIGPGLTGPIDELITTAELPGIYILNATDTNNNCVNSDTVIITEDINAPISEAGNSQEFDCSNDVLTLSGEASVGAVSFLWSNGLGNIISTSSETTVEEPGFYYLTVTSSNNCTAIDSVFIAANNNMPSDLIATIIEPTCFGDSDGSILIDAIVGGTAPYLYSIDGQNFSPTAEFPFLSGGTYNISVEDADGCRYDTELLVNDPTELILDIGNNFTIELGDDAQINADINISMGEVDTLIWTPFESLNCDNDPNCFNPSLDTLLYTTTFNALLIDTSGCTIEQQITVSVNKERPVFIPNAFSPDGDGINDIFMIYTGSGVAKINYFNIFSRWGETVFTRRDFLPNDSAFGWDGIYNNELVNDGVFVFVAEVEFIDGVKIIYKGEVTIMK